MVLIFPLCIKNKVAFSVMSTSCCGFLITTIWSHIYFLGEEFHFCSCISITKICCPLALLGQFFFGISTLWEKMHFLEITIWRGWSLTWKVQWRILMSYDATDGQGRRQPISQLQTQLQPSLLYLASETQTRQSSKQGNIIMSVHRLMT